MRGHNRRKPALDSGQIGGYLKSSADNAW